METSALSAAFDRDASIEAHISKIQRRIAECEEDAWARISALAQRDGDRHFEPDYQERFYLRRRAILAQFELEVIDMRLELVEIRKRMLNVVAAKMPVTFMVPK